jgi:sulfoxide reductase heme-binding subunit YedZ
MYAMVIVLASSWTRKYMRNKIWRNLHWFAFPAFALSMIHGIFTGTDTVRPWMWWTYLATGGIVVFLILVRAMTAKAARERADGRPAKRATPVSPARPVTRQPAARPSSQPSSQGLTAPPVPAAPSATTARLRPIGQGDDDDWLFAGSKK